MTAEAPKQLRRGWTTGACATGAATAALEALLKGTFPDPVTVHLPRGGTVDFALAEETLSADSARAGIIKDAGDDPDVTHGALVSATVRKGAQDAGVTFKAGRGVGTVTLPGLPIPPGEPAINPVPRQMMREAVERIAAGNGIAADFEIEVSIAGGETLALKTMNLRLGIVGGLSVLGTTGIVRPFSCASWIASIHRGVDVARATSLTHVVGATGNASEDAVRGRYRLPEAAFLDMGDFAGGLLKYIRAHPIERLTLAGGFAKFTKLANGSMDLHSARSQVDFQFLAALLAEAGAPADLVERTLAANTAKEVLDMATRAGIDLAEPVAVKAYEAIRSILRTAPIEVEVLVIGRTGDILAETGWRAP